MLILYKYICKYNFIVYILINYLIIFKTNLRLIINKQLNRSYWKVTVI